MADDPTPHDATFYAATRRAAHTPARIRPSEVGKARAYLMFFRVMAFVVGLGLLLLCVHLVIYYVPAISSDALQWWVIPHGYVYIVYLVAVVLLGFTVRWSLLKMVLVMLAGVVPFLSFYVEVKRAREVAAAIAAADARRRAVAGDPTP